jgi:hypothetical protein
MADVKFSEFIDGDAVQAGDIAVGLRGAANTRFDIDTAASKAATDDTQPSVVSQVGFGIVNNFPAYADTDGSIQNSPFNHNSFQKTGFAEISLAAGNVILTNGNPVKLAFDGQVNDVTTVKLPVMNDTDSHPVGTGLDYYNASTTRPLTFLKSDNSTIAVVRPGNKLELVVETNATAPGLFTTEIYGTASEKDITDAAKDKVPSLDESVAFAVDDVAVFSDTEGTLKNSGIDINTLIPITPENNQIFLSTTSTIDVNSTYCLVSGSNASDIKSSEYSSVINSNEGFVGDGLGTTPNYSQVRASFNALALGDYNTINSCRLAAIGGAGSSILWGEDVAVNNGSSADENSAAAGVNVSIAGASNSFAWNGAPATSFDVATDGVFALNPAALGGFAVGTIAPKAAIHTVGTNLIGASAAISDGNFPSSQPAINMVVASANAINFKYKYASETPKTVSFMGKKPLSNGLDGFVPALTNPATLVQLESSTNKNNARGWSFAASGLNYISKRIQMPADWDLGDFYFQVIWQTNSTSTNTVIWIMDAVLRNDAGASDLAFGSALMVSDAGSGTVNTQQKSSEASPLTSAGSAAANSVVEFRFYRNGGSGSDSLAVAAVVTNIIIYYTSLNGIAA